MPDDVQLFTTRAIWKRYGRILHFKKRNQLDRQVFLSLHYFTDEFKRWFELNKELIDKEEIHTNLKKKAGTLPAVETKQLKIFY